MVRVTGSRYGKTMVTVCISGMSFFTDYNTDFCVQFNFVGKLLGPGGNTLKRLQEETGCKMAIMGKGSMRDKAKVGSFSAMKHFVS